MGHRAPRAMGYRPIVAPPKPKPPDLEGALRAAYVDGRISFEEFEHGIDCFYGFQQIDGDQWPRLALVISDWHRQRSPFPQPLPPPSLLVRPPERRRWWR